MKFEHKYKKNFKSFVKVHLYEQKRKETSYKAPFLPISYDM